MLENIDLLQVREIISSVLILLGTCFMVISTIGLIRFPDFYIRMSAITKGTTLGVGLILSGMGVYFNDPTMLIKVLIIILFTFITSPVAAHVIARTAVFNKVPFWKNTNLKEFQDYMKKEQLEVEEGSKQEK